MAEVIIWCWDPQMWENVMLNAGHVAVETNGKVYGFAAKPNEDINGATAPQKTPSDLAQDRPGIYEEHGREDLALHWINLLNKKFILKLTQSAQRAQKFIQRVWERGLQAMEIPQPEAYHYHVETSPESAVQLVTHCTVPSSNPLIYNLTTHNCVHELVRWLRESKILAFSSLNHIPYKPDEFRKQVLDPLVAQKSDGSLGVITGVERVRVKYRQVNGCYEWVPFSES